MNTNNLPSQDETNDLNNNSEHNNTQEVLGEDVANSEGAGNIEEPVNLVDVLIQSDDADLTEEQKQVKRQLIQGRQAQEKLTEKQSNLQNASRRISNKQTKVAPKNTQTDTSTEDRIKNLEDERVKESLQTQLNNLSIDFEINRDLVIEQAFNNNQSVKDVVERIYPSIKRANELSEININNQSTDIKYTPEQYKEMYSFNRPLFDKLRAKDKSIEKFVV